MLYKELLLFYVLFLFPYWSISAIFFLMKKTFNILLICALFILAACNSSSEKLYYVTSTGAISYVRGKTLQGNITIPKNVNGQEVKTIADRGFEECYKVTSITIPDGITAIGGLAFSGCSSLKSIAIPDSVNEIGKEAFDGCKALESITIPNNVTTIHTTTFEECESLTTVKLGENLRIIESKAFESCSALSSITIPTSVKRIDSYAFHYCGNLKDIHYGSTKENWNKIEKADKWWEQEWSTDTLTIHCSDGVIQLPDGEK